MEKKKKKNLKKTFDSIGNILFVRIRVRVVVTKDSGRKKKKKQSLEHCRHSNTTRNCYVNYLARFMYRNTPLP